MNLDIDKSDLLNLTNIKLGLYKPIFSLSSLKEYNSILKFQKTEKNFYSIPFNLYANKNLNLKVSEKINLFYKKNFVGILNINEIFSPKLDQHNKKIYGTSSKNHLGVKYNCQKIKNKTNYLGGYFNLTNKKFLKEIFRENFKTIKEIKEIKDKKKYIIFSTRNIIHAGHNLIIEKLLKEKKKILIIILLSEKKKFKESILKKFYSKFVQQRKYQSKIIFKFLEIPTFFAGPREAAFQSKIFENLGFGYFYVGRDHAGYKNYYSKFSSQNFTKKLKLKIKIVGFNEPMYCSNCNVTVFNELKFGLRCKKCQSNGLKAISGTKLRRNLKKSKSLNNLISDKYLNFIKKDLL